MADPLLSSRGGVFGRNAWLCTPSCTHILCDGTLLLPPGIWGVHGVALANSTCSCTEPGETKPCHPRNKPGPTGWGMREHTEQSRPSHPAEAPEAGERPHEVGKVARSRSARPTQEGTRRAQKNHLAEL